MRKSKFLKMSNGRQLMYIAGMLSDVQECLDREDERMANCIIYTAKELLFEMEEVEYQRASKKHYLADL